MEADYDALLWQFVGVVLMGWVLALDIFICRTQTAPHQLSGCSWWSRHVTNNQWDSRSLLFISISSKTTLWNPCQVPGNENTEKINEVWRGTVTSIRRALLFLRPLKGHIGDMLLNEDFIGWVRPPSISTCPWCLRPAFTSVSCFIIFSSVWLSPVLRYSFLALCIFSFPCPFKLLS